MIAVIDCGIGNIGSVLNMLKKIGVDAIASSDINVIKEADKLILPGIGSFDSAMQKLKSIDLVEDLNRIVLDKKTPILGICLGMQLMTKSSEEGKLPGFGWIDARTVKFKFDISTEKLRLPHIGWNFVNVNKNKDFFKKINDEVRFYFVHSYHVACNLPEDIMTTTDYGYNFVSSFQHENIFGVQFHPEKSHQYGMNFLQSFIEGNCSPSSRGLTAGSSK
ncbi:MAG: imidazole glycerol phosphate synthase subunit HisH [Gammaproteobacteria bacterium]|jgi:glutamine amidotransferase